MSYLPSPSPVRWKDLSHPVVAGIVSVIVNYGGTFILVFQAAKVAGLSPELTASWVWSISIGVGVTLAAVFMAFPATFITTLAGLALLGTLGSSLASAMAPVETREAALITFLAAAANIDLLGIGGAFWGLVIGLVAYAVLNAPVPLGVSKSAGESTLLNKGAR